MPTFTTNDHLEYSLRKEGEGISVNFSVLRHSISRGRKTFCINENIILHQIIFNRQVNPQDFQDKFQIGISIFVGYQDYGTIGVEYSS